jgi:hypothetical protein
MTKEEGVSSSRYLQQIMFNEPYDAVGHRANLRLDFLSVFRHKFRDVECGEDASDVEKYAGFSEMGTCP